MMKYLQLDQQHELNKYLGMRINISTLKERNENYKFYGKRGKKIRQEFHFDKFARKSKKT